VTDRVGDDDALFVDVRETAELVKNGQIPGAVHAPRGMLEPHIGPGSPTSWSSSATRRSSSSTVRRGRSALAAQTAKEMWLGRVASIDGGLTAWKEAGGRVEEPRATMT
jgi:rhodanese-related sulfurtransferase